MGRGLTNGEADEERDTDLSFEGVMKSNKDWLPSGSLTFDGSDDTLHRADGKRSQVVWMPYDCV